MRNFAFFGIVFILLQSCKEEPALKVSLAYLLHDDSSKVWMVKSELINDEEFAPENINFRTVIVFYDDDSYSEQPLNSMGNRPPTYGKYEIEYQNEAITFVLSRKKNTFKVDFYSKSMIVLKAKDEKETIELILVPLPKI